MIVVADSGSTKTDWAFASEEASMPVIRVSTKGLNPYYVDTRHAVEVVLAAVPEENTEQISAVYFYGAGCSTQEKCDMIDRALSEVFHEAEISVHHDMLGAARATCGTSPGVVSILGTGSNSCVYDGVKIVDALRSLGFILGDEGSGGAIGRELIRCRVYREMPEALEKAFDKAFSFSVDELLDHVYGDDAPNRYVASYSIFCSQFKTSPFIQALLKRVFENFIHRNLMKYQQKGPFHFVGSIATVFEQEICAAMEENQLEHGVFMKQPIEALIDYHRS